MATNCRRLLTDVKAAQAYAPMPDATTQRLWADALTSYTAGATHCAHGADTANYDLIIRASKEFDHGTADIKTVATRLKKLTGR
jgi:hypothetical protein